MGYGDMRAKKSRVHTRIINSGSEEVNSMKQLLYGEQSRGCDGNQGWVSIYHGRVYPFVHRCKPRALMWGQMPWCPDQQLMGADRCSVWGSMDCLSCLQDR